MKKRIQKNSANKNVITTKTNRLLFLYDMCAQHTAQTQKLTGTHVQVHCKMYLCTFKRKATGLAASKTFTRRAFMCNCLLFYLPHIYDEGMPNMWTWLCMKEEQKKLRWKKNITTQKPSRTMWPERDVYTVHVHCTYVHNGICLDTKKQN